MTEQTAVIALIALIVTAGALYLGGPKVVYLVAKYATWGVLDGCDEYREAVGGRDEDEEEDDGGRQA